MSARPYEKPKAMSLENITETQNDFVQAALAARKAGFDGIEIHAGNGYLFDQFHHSNINQREDNYGGDLHRRCRFTIETVEKLCRAVGPGRVGVRLSPFGLFNETLGTDRVAQWKYLCQELSNLGIAYLHLIEPRFDELKSAQEKQTALIDMTESGGEISLKPFKRAGGSTPVIAAGGFGPDNMQEGIQAGEHDLVAFGRYFTSNADLVQRLRDGQPLYRWNRARFYGPFDDNEIGYTVHPEREWSVPTDRLKAQLAA